MRQIKQEIEDRFDDINTWIHNQKEKSNSIIYSSIDIRESDFKIASVDTNLFPAGFNNLDQNHHFQIEDSIKEFFKKEYPTATNILLFCEDHTRNLYYLENVFQLTERLKKAGLTITIGTFFNDHPHICETKGFANLNTSENNECQIFCLKFILKNRDKFKIDLCLLNNDLSDGKVDQLKELNIPICPSTEMGWHNRKKSTHINHLNHTTKKMIEECKLSIDPWLLSTLYCSEENVNINLLEDRERLAQSASTLFNEIQAKYDKHQIKNQPYLIIKSDNGTYGMGVISINSPSEIRELNRKNRNKLFKGKSSIPIENIIIQEGIPSIKKVDSFTSEEVIYNVNGKSIGGFFRVHKAKSEKDILNSKGMQFRAFDVDINHHFNKPNVNLAHLGISKTSYIIAQLANLSAQKEVSIL